MTSEAKLLPCPFCGEAKRIGHDATQEAIMCFDCLCAGPEHVSQEQAIIAWNRRTPTALAESPDVSKLIAEAEARGWNNGMRIATSHVAEVRNTQKPGAIFAALNEAMGRIEGARFSAIRLAAEIAAIRKGDDQ